MSSLNFSRLGYGAANVGNLYRALTDEVAWDILQTAWDVGVRYFDTAPHYGLGLSERRLGAFLATKPRDQFIVSTKVGRLLRPNHEGVGTLDLANDFAVPADLKRVWDFSPNGVRQSVEESLQRTGLDRFDALFLHDPERHNLRDSLDEAIPALADLRSAGLVTAIGVGSMETEALLASVQTGALDLLMVAGRYTLAEQPALEEVIPAARANGVGIVNASVFNSGLLASENPKAGARYDYGDAPVVLLERVWAIAAVCREFNVSLPAAALQYTLRDDTVRTIVVGGSSAQQVRQNSVRMDEFIPEELWRALVEKNLIPV